MKYFLHDEKNYDELIDKNDNADSMLTKVLALKQRDYETNNEDTETVVVCKKRKKCGSLRFGLKILKKKIRENLLG